jgi:hypothetical protein
MKTRLLKRLRKDAKDEYKIEAFSDYYRIVSYAKNSQGNWYPIVMDSITMKELAIKKLFEHRRNFILNAIKAMRTEKLNKELRKI